MRSNTKLVLLVSLFLANCLIEVGTAFAEQAPPVTPDQAQQQATPTAPSAHLFPSAPTLATPPAVVKPAPAAPVGPQLIGFGDPKAGATIFTVNCVECHQVGASAMNGVGPGLNGVVGGIPGNYPGYAYSEAIKNAGLVWDVATLVEYLTAPKALVPGTKMGFGLPQQQDVLDVIAYLREFDILGHTTAQP